MPSDKLTLIKGEKVDSDVDYRDQLPVNMYAVKKDILGAQGYMLSYPGLSSFGTVVGKDRGATYNERKSNHFRVSGNSLIEVDITGTQTILGTISGRMQAAMPYSFNTQAIIADGRMWLYSVAEEEDDFIEVLDEDLGDPIDGIWIDGYYFMTDGEYLFHTDIDDETSIDPLKFSTALFSPDPTLGLLKTQDNKVCVLGRYSIEYFQNVATDNFAFQRIESRAQKIGIVATHAKCEAKGQFYIVGGRKNDSVGIHAFRLGATLKISTREVDKLIAEYTEPELIDIRMESRQADDVLFILIHLPDYTLCYNDTIASSFGRDFAWTILKTDIKGNTPYRGINGIFDARISKWIYGDKSSNTIGKLDNSICTHYGENVEWQLYTPLKMLETMSINELELQTIPGLNTSEGATVAVSITYNGVSFGTEWWTLYSLPTDHNQRFILRGLGYVSEWVGFKFRGVSSHRMAFALCKVTYG